jgi:hypothetical protein
MMGAGYGGNAKTEVCHGSLERELERVDNQLTEMEAFALALDRFLTSPIRHDVLGNREEHTFLYALYGALAIRLPQLRGERLPLIELIEKEAARKGEDRPLVIAPLFDVRDGVDSRFDVGFDSPDGVWRAVDSFALLVNAEKRADELNGVRA